MAKRKPEVDISVEVAETWYNKRVAEWFEAAQECTRTYVAWQEACDRRERAAAIKVDAWGELEMARAAYNGRQRKAAHTNGDGRPATERTDK